MCGGDRSSAKARSREVARQLFKDHANFKKELKLLLLGTGESGKSTIIKQMRIIYGKGFSKDARGEYTTLVYKNILRSMKNMLDAMDLFNIELRDKTLQQPSYDLQDTDEETYNSIEPHIELYSKLWQDPGIQEAFERRNEYQLSDSTPYFLAELQRIGQGGYIPDEQDILRAREPTTGIHEYEFVLEKAVFRMLDVGGQRSERRKWIHCFENITSIIFIVAMSEYDQSLVEQPDCNRMEESTALFEQIINYWWFRHTSFILFLNKKDLLEQKIAKSPIVKYFPDYADFPKGESEIDTVQQFILSMYRVKKPDDIDIYPHFTMATDTENIKFVFNSVKSTILRLHLKDYNLF